MTIEILSMLLLLVALLAALSMGVSIVALKRAEKGLSNLIESTERQAEVNRNLIDSCRHNTESLKLMNEGMNELLKALQELQENIEL